MILSNPTVKPPIQHSSYTKTGCQRILPIDGDTTSLLTRYPLGSTGMPRSPEIHPVLHEMPVRLGVPRPHRRHRKVEVYVTPLAHIARRIQQPAFTHAQLLVGVGPRLANAPEVHVERWRVKVLKHISRCRAVNGSAVWLHECDVIPPSVAVTVVSAVASTLGCRVLGWD